MAQKVSAEDCAAGSLGQRSIILTSNQHWPQKKAIKRTKDSVSMSWKSKQNKPQDNLWSIWPRLNRAMFSQVGPCFVCNVHEHEGDERRDCSQVNMDVTTTGFQMFSKWALQVFCDEGNALNMFVRPPGYTKWALIVNRHLVCLQQNTTEHL